MYTHMNTFVYMNFEYVYIYMCQWINIYSCMILVMHLFACKQETCFPFQFLHVFGIPAVSCQVKTHIERQENRKHSTMHS